MENPANKSARRLQVSFSGGRSSGLMLHMALNNMRSQYDDMVVTFCNTGQEDPRTLQFVDEVDRQWKAGVVWLEAVVDMKPGAGTKHRVVDFSNADREGRVFESVIQKYGIPNQAYRGHCTRELKLQPMTSYLRSIGWEAGSYDVAIGIRADEIDRISPDKERLRLVYPLAKGGIKKADVLYWWSKQAFDLAVPEHYGNCVWCWKKSLRKHLTLAKDSPGNFDFPRRMEHLYANAGAGDGARTFFRGHRSAEDIIKLSQLPFIPFEDAAPLQLPLLDIDLPSGGCGESCEVYADE